jgi:protein-L-isoaspartate O-methyltransferase
MTAGCKEFAPYNIIFIAGALQEVPDSLFGQLEDGGKIITILYKESDYVQNVDSALGTVVMIVKNDDILSKFELFSVNCFTLDLYDNTQKEYTH